MNITAIIPIMKKKNRFGRAPFLSQRATCHFIKKNIAILVLQHLYVVGIVAIIVVMVALEIYPMAPDVAVKKLTKYRMKCGKQNLCNSRASW